jgi:uncharacterized protein (DUF362 family)/ferredoxin
MKHITVIRTCKDYDPATVESIVNHAWVAAGGPNPKGKTVLLKPNLIKGASPAEAVSTHPTILRAAIRYCKSQGATRIVVGDSPGYQSFQVAAKKSRLMEVIEEEGVEFDDFSRFEMVDFPEGRLVKSFKLAKAIREADIVVSLPKLKTHTFLQFTGAIKNLFGAVPGNDKAAFHLQFFDKLKFGQMIVDLAACIGADFAIMDAVVGMEGPGPGSGYPRYVGQILASTDLLALDRCACRLIGYDPDEIPYLKAAAESGVWLKAGEETEIDGPDPRSVAVKGFKTIKSSAVSGLQNLVPGPLRAAIRGITNPLPKFDPDACILCSGCVMICPAKALSVVPGAKRGQPGKKIFINAEACIRCYCCHEVCPVFAIKVGREPKRQAPLEPDVTADRG